MQHCLP
jgi:methylase of polypeptide subunit release factors